ncbi:MAG: EVE domain-containing protein [Candidatus Velthaea sp.]
MQYWLFKSEPDTYGIDRLEREGGTEWSGVRNFRARNHMRAMNAGDRGFFYHSSTKVPGIAGICEVTAAAHPDSSQFDPQSEYYDATSRAERPKWWCVDVAFVSVLPRFVSLAELRAMRELDGMPLLRRGQRLSVQPVSAEHWQRIVAAADAPPRPSGTV